MKSDKGDGPALPSLPRFTRGKNMSKLDKIEQAIANKSRAYWASMRNTMMLMDRSDVVDESTIDALRTELGDILDSGILTYPHTLAQAGLEPDMNLDQRKEALGVIKKEYIYDENQLKFIKSMAYKADAIRKTDWSWRIGQEAEELQDAGWHPFFVTLTVDPQKTDPKNLWMEGRELRKYIRRLVNVVCKELGHPPAHKMPYRPESEYVRYAGVIEHGKSREHHHGHFIIWLKCVPSEWRKCPNSGIRNPSARTKNECLPLRTLWPWSLPGLSPALYFRSVGDIWEKAYDFVLPLKDGKPMKVSVPRTAGAYITKYLSKEHKEWHHRMKATRNLGMMRLRQKLKTMNVSEIEALTWRAKSSSMNISLMTTHSVPLGLLRSEAKRQNYLNRFRLKLMDLRELLASNYGIFSKMLWSVRNGQRPDRMDSQQFYDWVGRLLPGVKGYSDMRLLAAHANIAMDFPRNKKNIKPVKIGANEI